MATARQVGTEAVAAAVVAIGLFNAAGAEATGGSPAYAPIPVVLGAGSDSTRTIGGKSGVPVRRMAHASAVSFNVPAGFTPASIRFRDSAGAEITGLRVAVDVGAFTEQGVLDVSAIAVFGAHAADLAP